MQTLPRDADSGVRAAIAGVARDTRAGLQLRARAAMWAQIRRDVDQLGGWFGAKSRWLEDLAAETDRVELALQTQLSRVPRPQRCLRSCRIQMPRCRSRTSRSRRVAAKRTARSTVDPDGGEPPGDTDRVALIGGAL